MSEDPSPSPPNAQPKKSQATSCAECRRLKLKCDRVFPCSSCIRRGCANLCPTGTLEKGKRGFLKRLEQSLPSLINRNGIGPNSGGPTTEVAMFVARDAAMSKRIQELETALIDAGVPVPGLPHAVAKRTNAANRKRSRSSSTREAYTDTEHPFSFNGSPEFTDVTMGLGTLTIDPLNRAKYIGLSGASAFLSPDTWSTIYSQRQENETDADYASGNEIQLKLLSKMSVLPPYDEAIRLSGLYFFNNSFMYEIVPEEIFMKGHLPTTYERFTVPGEHVAPDTLSLVCMVLALGQYFDLSRPLEEIYPRVANLFDVAVYTLNISNTVNGATTPRTIQGVQALHLMATYQITLRGDAGVEAGWQILGMVSRSLQAQGLHRDGSRWGLSPCELEERRRVFWETYTFDRMQSFALGRPYSLAGTHHDCEMPATSDHSLPSDHDNSNTFSHTRFHHHKFRWAILIGRIVDLAFSTKQLTYDIIKKVDREINDYYFSLPPWIRCPAVTRPVEDNVWERVCPKAHSRPHGTSPDFLTGLGKAEDQRRDAQIYTLSVNIFVAILLLHRGPFCKALILEPQELVRSPYESSVSRVTSAATSIINIARGLYVLHPAHTTRVWHWLFHVFTAAVCQAVFVTTAPFHPLAPQALKSLKVALELFERAETRVQVLARGRLEALSQKASAAMDRYMSSSFAKSRTGRDVPNGMGPALRGGLPFPLASPAALKNLSTGSSLDVCPTCSTEDFLGTSTKLVRMGSPVPSSVSSGGSGSSPGGTSAPSPPTSTTSSPSSDVPSQHAAHPQRNHDRGEGPGDDGRHQQHYQQHHRQQRDRRPSMDSLDIFSQAPANHFDPWFQTFTTITNERNQDDTPVPPPSNVKWTGSSNPQPEPQLTNGGNFNDHSHPAPYDPNSYNDLDYTGDTADVRELSSLLEWRNSIATGANANPSQRNGHEMHQSDAYDFSGGGSNVFDSSNFMQEPGAGDRWFQSSNFSS
ncbi:hypothetical protein PM082_010206 [Marasmius tenuissimus]|nr:hypothetical protein PM082_010206 [Marasmius tenuissimus]